MKFKWILLTLSLLLSSCETPSERYLLLYPIQASKQSVLRLEGQRFLSSELSSPASILILNNPIQNGGFVDIALAITHHETRSRTLHPKDISVQLSQKGHLKLLNHQEYQMASPYTKPNLSAALLPKMKSYGCASNHHADNINQQSFSASQAWVWKRHLRYPFKDDTLYLKRVKFEANSTQGAIFRVELPKMPTTFEQATLFIKVSFEDHEDYRFKFILQALN